MSVVRKDFWHVVSRMSGGVSLPRKYGLSGCMPAVVRSTDGSYSAGTSENDGRRLWSRSSKKLRKDSRISSEVTPLMLCASDGPAAHDRTVAAEEDRGLAGRGAVERLEQLDLPAAQPARHRTRPVAELDPLDLVLAAVQPHRSHRDAVRGERLARPDRDRVRARVRR